MNSSIKKTGQVYKCLVLIFTVVYWAYIIIDDYIFIEKYWNDHWLFYLVIWTGYYLGYLFVLSIFFWVTTLLGMFVYNKLIKLKAIINK